VNGSDKALSCDELLNRVEETISSVGFFAARQGNAVVSMLGVEGKPLVMAYVVECQDGEVVISGGIKGFTEALGELPCEKREEILREILRIPSVFRVIVHLDEDVLTIDVPVEGDPLATALAGFTLVARLAAWLPEQIDRAKRGEPVQPFSEAVGVEDEG